MSDRDRLYQPKAFSIQSRLYKERDRVQMTESERKWRALWVRDQVLTDREPLPPSDERYRARHNIVKRTVWLPLNLVFRPFQPIFGKHTMTVRKIVGAMGHMTAITFLATYYFKYNAHDWTRKGGWRVTTSRPSCVPGDPGFPKASDKKKPSDYASRGFEHSPI